MAAIRRRLTFENMDEMNHVGVRLGKGAYAQVKLIQHKDSEIMLALKVIDLSNSMNVKWEKQQILTECRTHKDLNHPNIIE